MILCRFVDVQKRQDPVKAKIVELIQVWSHAFRNEPSYRVVQDTFNDMIREGLNFVVGIQHFFLIFESLSLEVKI